jgi:hypothetical protein
VTMTKNENLGSARRVLTGKKPPRSSRKNKPTSETSDENLGTWCSSVASIYGDSLLLYLYSLHHSREYESSIFTFSRLRHRPSRYSRTQYSRTHRYRAHIRDHREQEKQEKFSYSRETFDQKQR